MDTAAQTTASSSNPVIRGDEEIVEYRTLSVLAIISLVCGVAAPLSLFAPVLLAIAFFGAAASLIALRRIASSDGLLAGRGAALVGLALCVASAGAVYGRAAATRQLLSHEANEAAIHWFDDLRSGRVEQAFAMTRGRLSEPPQKEPEDYEHEHEGASHALEHFLEIPVVRALTTAGAGATIKWERTLSVTPSRPGLGTVEQLYAVTPSDSAQEAFQVRLTLQLAIDPGAAQPAWSITAIDLENPPATPAEGV